jgi:2-methylcitrate dehydratase PrpD
MTTLPLTRKLAEFSVDFSLGQAPGQVLENAKIAILDCLGVALLAASEETGKALFRFAQKESSPGPCILWGSELSSGARDAALVNATLAHALDYDDGSHSSTYILAATLALAERENTSGETLAASFIVSREVRMALDSLFSSRDKGEGPGARGWHANGILGPIAAACGACRVLRLDVNQTLGSISLASGSCGALGRDGGTFAKPFRAGHAAASGVTCALLAREEFSGDEESIEGPYGLLSALGPIAPAILTTLGEGLALDYALSKGIRIKKYPAAHAIEIPVEAMLRLVRTHKIVPDEVEEIECDLKPFPLLRHSPRRGFEGRFSMPFCLAIAIIYGRLDSKCFTDEHAQDPRVQRLVTRTRHVPGAKTLILTLRNGRKLTESMQPVHEMSASWEEVTGKFMQSTRETLAEERQQEVIDLVRNLEKLRSVRLLTGAIRKSGWYAS